MTERNIRYQLVFQFTEDFFDSFDAMIEFENKLIGCMPKTCDVDGHDIGSGTINFFVFTAFPEAAFRAFRKYLGTNKVEKNIRVAFREVNAESYTNLWPKRDSREFRCV